MTKVVIFNCPPRSGKDSVADYITGTFNGFDVACFKDKLFSIAMEVSNMGAEFLKYYEEEKEKPWPELGNMTPRNFLIKISEEWIKPIFGKRYFGEALVRDILDSEDLYKDLGRSIDYYLVTDGGFKEEIEPLIESFGKENVLILQWDREGCTFDNDSRTYIKDYPEITLRIPSNNGNLSRFAMDVEKIIFNHFNRL